jgi:hypothetical protein
MIAVASAIPDFAALHPGYGMAVPGSRYCPGLIPIAE